MPTTASGAFGPAPAGLDLGATQNKKITDAIITMIVISSIAVGLRLIARTKQKGIDLAIDDYLIIGAHIFASGTATCCLISLNYGGGKHLWVLTAAEFTTVWKILFAYVIIYAIAVSLTKASIVMFYWRLFRLRWQLCICMFLVLSYPLVIIITVTTGCQPLSYFWTQYTHPTSTGHCIDVPLFFFANGIWAMLVDVCILVVPVPVIYRLNMPKKQKLVVASILLLGSFVCVASIIRVITIHTLMHSEDLTWAMADVFIWSCCEPFIGIVCACLPTLAPLLRRWWSSIRTTDQNSSKDGNNTGYFKSTKMDPSASNAAKKTREWNRLDDNTRVRNDDEVELNVNISGPGTSKSIASVSDQEVNAYPLQEIMVKKDFVWSST